MLLSKDRLLSQKLLQTFVDKKALPSYYQQLSCEGRRKLSLGLITNQQEERDEDDLLKFKSVGLIIFCLFNRLK